MLLGKKGEDPKFTELIEIKDVPDTGSDPEQIEVTTLKDPKKRYIKGRQDCPAQAFTYNYEDEKFHKKVLPYCDGKVNEFLVKFPDGSGYTIKGSAETYVKGFGVNAPIEAVLTIAPEEIVFKTAEEVTALLAG